MHAFRARLGSIVLVACFVLGAIATGAIGADLRSDIQEILGDGVPALPASLHVRWEQEFHVGLTPSEIQELRRRVDGRPDHPDRAELQDAERRLANGPDRVVCDVYLGPKGEFRYSETQVGGGTLDVVILDGDIWVLAGDALTFTKADKPPPGRNFAPHRNAAARQIGQFRRGALSLLFGVPSANLESFRQGGDRWEADVSAADGVVRLAVEGTIVGDAPVGVRARISELRLSPEEVGRRVVASEPWRDSPLGPVMRVCEEYSPAGVLMFRNRLLDAEPLPRGDWFRRPDRDATRDAFRGEIRVGSVADFRSSLDGDFWTRSSGGDEWEKREVPESAARRAARQLDTVGYAVIGGVGLVIGGVWLLRRRSAGA